jgi:predicted GNAT superfamily acetyltransferase
MEQSDIEAVQTLNEAALPHVTSMSIAACERLLGQSSIAVAVQDESQARPSLVGFCLVLGPGQEYTSVNYRWVMDRYDDALYLDRVVVASGWRGKGVGRLIYAEVERQMIESWPQFSTLALEVNLDPPNPESFAFHSKLGFESVGEQTTPYQARVALMAKPILGRKTGGRD